MSRRDSITGASAKTPFLRSISYRFALSVLILTIVLSAVFIGIEGYRSYRSEVRGLNRQLVQIEESHIPSIVSSLWLTDRELLQSQLEAIALFSHVSRVEVVDDEGTVFVAGLDETDGLSPHDRTLVYTRRDTEIAVGSLRLYVDQSELRSEVLQAEVFSAIGHLSLAVVIAVAVGLLFRRQVGVHLERLAVHVDNTDTDEGDVGFALRRRSSRGDELDRLVSAINDMRRRLHADARERELLVGEVHHRIKNDMSFVKALLSLQAGRSGSAETASALNEASQRIAVMGQVYERVYRSDDMHNVGLKPLVEQVVDDFRSRGILAPSALTTAVDSASVSIRISIAIGVILNELITNAVKYSVSSEDSTKIVVTARSRTDGEIELTVADDGDGFPDDIVRGESLGYGLTIVKALAEQYDGSLMFANDDGALVAVTVRDRIAPSEPLHPQTPRRGSSSSYHSSPSR
ncbi:MAG: sensor histidine kinase [Spirochaetota bacterium]